MRWHTAKDSSPYSPIPASTTERPRTLQESQRAPTASLNIAAVRRKRRIANVAIADIRSGNPGRCGLTNRLREQSATALARLSDIHDPLSVRRNVQLAPEIRAAIQVTARNVDGDIGRIVRVGWRPHTRQPEGNRDQHGEDQHQNKHNSPHHTTP